MLIDAMQNIGIILEGADQSGKSTLAQKLSDLTGHSVLHFDPPKKGTTDFYAEYTNFLNMGGRPIVDRNYMSEMVYGKLFRGGSGVTDIVKKQIETTLWNQNYVLVLCHRRNFNFEERKEMYDQSQIMEVRKEFLDQFEDIALPKIVVDPFSWPKCLWQITDLCLMTYHKIYKRGTTC